jgi:hypothetical protein
MVAGGKPLWYLQIATTASTLILTVFFTATCMSWASGLGEPVKPPKYPKDEWNQLVKERIEPFRASLKSAMLWINLAVGTAVVAGGAAFGYLMYRSKTKLLYSQIWFGLVAAFTLVWMICSIVFYVNTEELAGNLLSDHRQSLTGSLSSVYRWGKKRSGTTVIGLVIFPTGLYLFLTFVAYRLYSKLEIFGNEAPEKVNREYAPGTWVERSAAAEGGSWERDEAAPLVKAQEGEEGAEPTTASQVALIVPGDGEAEEVIVKPLEEVQNAVLIEDAKTDSMTGGIGSWLEDVFDYTF